MCEPSVEKGDEIEAGRVAENGLTGSDRAHVRWVGATMGCAFGRCSDPPRSPAGYGKQASQAYRTTATPSPGRIAQELDAELEVVHARALVRRVDEPRCELRIHVAQREEAVRDGPERVAHPVAVREAAEADRCEPRLGLRLGHPTRNRVPERPFHRRARPALALEPLELVVALAEELANDLLRLGLRLAGQQPAVDGHLAERRNHVPLLRGGRPSSARRSSRAAARRARLRSDRPDARPRAPGSHPPAARRPRPRRARTPRARAAAPA